MLLEGTCNNFMKMHERLKSLKLSVKIQERHMMSFCRKFLALVILRKNLWADCNLFIVKEIRAA